MSAAGADGSSSTTEGTFTKFFEYWLQEQDQHLQILVSAAKEYENKARNGSSMEEGNLRSLVNRTMQRYEHYYQVKEKQVKEDALAMMSPSWTSTLEDAFLWIGGWRPTMAFHLLYSKSGLQVESCLHELMQGLGLSDLGTLSGTQMARIDKLHKETTRKERQINEKFAKHQESVADTSMVKLSNVASEVLRSGETSRLGEDQVEIETTLHSKEAGFAKIIRKADALRLETLKAVVEILTPIQAVHYLTAAAELQLRVHDWGKKRDHDKHLQPDNSNGTNQHL